MKKIPYGYHLVTMMLFIALKAWYPHADHEQLLFILKPTNYLIELFSGAASYYDPGQGYLYPELNITIEKSCSGFNFLLLCFALFVFVSLLYIKDRKARYFVIPSMLALSYVLTLLVNASRIISSLVTENYVRQFNGHPIAWLHQAEGAFIYLLFLILFYSALHFFFTKTSLRHEKLA